MSLVAGGIVEMTSVAVFDMKYITVRECTYCAESCEW
jgi:hypothetical protein